MTNCSHTSTPKKRFICDKWVRSGEKAYLEAHGICATLADIEEKERPAYLLKKIVEEAQEALWCHQAGCQEKTIKELADTYEAFFTALEAMNLPLETILKIQKEKQGARGTYAQGTRLCAVEMAADNPKLDHYIRHGEAYVLASKSTCS